MRSKTFAPHLAALLLGIAGVCALFLSCPSSEPRVVEAIAPAAWTPPATTGSHLRMYRLAPGGALRQLPTECTPGNIKYGCTAFCDSLDPNLCPQGVPKRPYPYSSSTPDISFAKDYLLDVVGQETSPDTFVLQALQAQAIASRSFIWYLSTTPLPSSTTRPSSRPLSPTLENSATTRTTRPTLALAPISPPTSGVSAMPSSAAHPTISLGTIPATRSRPCPPKPAFSATR